MLMRVVGNILDNAKKYCDDQGKVELSAVETDGKFLYAYGIPVLEFQGRQEKIFDKFLPEPVPPEPIKKGSGLGLAIVKAVIDAHGGSVW